MIDIDDTTLHARTAAATDLVLTSGIIEYADIERGWWDQPDPADALQRSVILAALSVICGGLAGGVAQTDLLIAWNTQRLLHAAVEAVLAAIDIIRKDNAR